MIVAERQHVVSSFTMIKGAMIPETYEVLARWDFELDKKPNLDRLRDENYIGAPASTWLRDVAKVLNRRLDPEGRDRPLAVFAKAGFPIEEWKPILLWHITRDEFLFRDFVENWLFDAYREASTGSVRRTSTSTSPPSRARRTDRTRMADLDARTGRNGPAQDGGRLRTAHRGHREGVRPLPRA